jgi:PDZ domain-containing protein
LVALAPVLVFGLMLGTVTVPYVALGPGPTFNTLGIGPDGKDVVDIEGTKVFPVTGHLNMTTVAQIDDLILFQSLLLWVSGRDQLLPRDLVYPPGKSREEVDKSNSEDFEDSETKAQSAALGYLKYPPALTVDTVTKDGASAGKLQVGDAIDKVNGTPITSTAQLQDLLKNTKPGDQVVVDYRRRLAPPGTTTITLGKGEDPRGYLGVRPGYAPWAPFKVTFNLANIGGPSAGLMFALAVVDKLTDGDLTGNKFVAGTGTIDDDGKVGDIGGITHKMFAASKAGATVFLVPADNCAEARTGNDEGLELARVETLTQAVDALHTISAGGEPPRC